MYKLQDGNREYTSLDSAKAAADRKVASAPGTEVKVIHVETDAVVYATSQRAILKRDEGIHFVPLSRLETPMHVAPDFEGFVPAYTRKRIGATVYRKNDFERGEAGQWRVFDGRTGKFRDVDNTKAACALTTAMRQGLQL